MSDEIDVRLIGNYTIELNEQGPPGAPGLGIASITEIGYDSSTGIHTYRITYTDGTHYDFEISGAIQYEGGEGIIVNGEYISIDALVVATKNDLLLKQNVINNDNKLQSDLVDDTNQDNKFATQAQLTQISTNENDISTINSKISDDATSSNKLTDKNYVDTVDNSLQEQINNLKARGRFLALWNCATGLAETNPPQSPYTYHTGDYFIVGTISSATPQVNYKPSGSSYTTGVASSTLETNVVDVDDVYYYDGTSWHLQVNTQKTVSFVNIAGDPYDNTNLSTALNDKQNASTAVTHTENNAVGSATKGVYVASDGTATAMTYSVSKDVPSNAEFTDTIYTIATGSSNGTISVAVNGGTPSDVSVYGLDSAAYTSSSDYATSTQGGKADTAVQPSDLATVATTGDYGDLLNKPTIPTVNDGTITLTQDGVTKGTFTVNQSGNTTIDLSGGSSSEFEAGNSLQMTEVTFSVPTDAFNISTFRNIAYVNNKFIATAYNSSGYYATSTNGTTWSTGSNYSLRNKYWNGIGYIAGTYVIVSSEGYISTSSNGTSWGTPTQNSNLGSHNWQKIASNGSKLVIISQDGYISTSTDGTTWSVASYKSALGSNRYWWGITYGNNKFVALSTGGYISTSEDGETWTSSVQNSNLGSISWRGLAYNNGKYIAIANGTGLSNYGSMSTSTDGTTWVAAYVNPSLKQKINWDAGIAYGDSKFVAMGSSGYISYWDGVTTTDRLDVIVDLNLSNPSSNPVSSSAVNTALNQKQGTLSAVSPLSLTNNTLRLTMDTQLSTTSTRPLTNSAITNAINSIDIPEYHEGTSISITQSPAVFDFSSLTSISISGSDSWHDITYNGGRYIAVGDNEQFYHSTNGTTWQSVSGAFDFNSLIGVAYNGTSLCYAITDSSYIYKYTYNSTIQDFVYTDMIEAPSGSTYSSIAYGNGLFVISGEVGNVPFIFYGDGTNSFSSEILSGSVGTIYKVIYDGTRFVAACSDGKIGTSTNGSTWTFSQINSISDDIRTIAYDTTTYIAMVGTNTILKSTDLTNWTETTEQTMDNARIRYSAACNGCFAFIAQTNLYDYVLYTSTDGSTWVTHSFANDYSVFESPRCIAYCNDNFLFGFDFGGMYKVDGTSFPTINCVVDSQLSLLSDNPVKNSVIAAAIGDIETLLSQV